MGARSHARWGIGGALLVCAAVNGPGPAAGLSTALARFLEPAVAGPGVPQQVHLLLHYYPGDGEAIVSTTLAGPTSPGLPGGHLRAARSSLGAARVESARTEIDYLERPLDAAVVDTVELELQTGSADQLLEWTVSVHSTLQDSATPGFVTSAQLAVEAPVRASVRLSPAQVFAGERANLRLAVRNDDPEARALTRLHLNWPDSLGLIDRGLQAVWSPPLQPGESDTLEGVVQMGAEVAGSVEIGVRVDAVGVVGSPAGPLVLEIRPLPRVRFAAGDAAAVLGEHLSRTCVVYNPSAASIELEALRLELGPAFDRVRASLVDADAKDGAGQVAVRNQTDGGVQIELSGPRVLDPGAELRLRVEARPQRVGPHRWRALARPQGHETFVPLEASTGVAVRRVADLQDRRQPRSLASADLEMLQSAVRAALRARTAGLPMALGAPVTLASAELRSRDWVVADVLTSELLERGYRVRLDGDGAPESPAQLLRYRVADARVVYLPGRQRWRPWARRTERQAFADVVLQLEDSRGEMVWAERLHAYAADTIAGGPPELPGGSDLVERTVIASDGKMVERTLSAVMLGGLAYIFFVL